MEPTTMSKSNDEIVKEFENIFCYQYELSEGFERPIGSEPSFRKELRAEHMGDVLRLLAEAKQYLRTILAAKDKEAEERVREERDRIAEGMDMLATKYENYTDCEWSHFYGEMLDVISPTKTDEQ